MARSQTLKAVTLAFLIFPLLVGCASLNAYRDSAERINSRYTVIDNYGTAPIDPDKVDELLLDVAYLLGVELSPKVPKARIIVTTPTKIASLYSSGAAGFGGHSYAVGLYFPGTSLVMVPEFERVLLGHELAHYVTDHYLKGAKRSEWEDIAHKVERQLWRTVKRPVSNPVVVADSTPPTPQAVTP